MRYQLKIIVPLNRKGQANTSAATFDKGPTGDRTFDDGIPFWSTTENVTSHIGVGIIATDDPDDSIRIPRKADIDAAAVAVAGFTVYVDKTWDEVMVDKGLQRVAFEEVPSR